MSNAEPSRAEVAGQLDRILRSELFSSAGPLDGRSAELKESTIGVDAFGRPPGYDPRTDPIVRVEARRLRSRLADYYAGPGADDPVVIDLPKGGYVPSFTSRECTPAAGSRLRWPVIGFAAAILVLAGAAWWLARPDPSPTSSSVAVMPFVNLSTEPANDYFSDGLTDELIDNLSRVPGLRVVGRSLVFQHKGKNYDAQALGRQWNAAAVLEGSVRKSGHRLRITAQLTNTSDGYNLWSQTYDRELQDVFAIQREIATAIAKAMRVTLGGGAGKAEPRRTNLAAYNHYLEGRYQLNRYSGESFRLGIQSLEQAIAADPSYVPAYTLLARLYGMAGYYYVLPPAEAWAKAKRQAQRALEIDPNDGEAHGAIGFVLGMHEWKWAESEREFRRALELNPSSADIHTGYAVATLMPQARLEEAVAEYRKSMDIDPLTPFSNIAAGFALLALKRYDEALVQYKRGLELISTFREMWWDAGMCYALMGKRDEAMAHFRKAGGIEDGRDWEPGPAVHALLGNSAEAYRQMREWERRVRTPETGDYMDIARTYGMLGDVPNTLRWLDGAWKVRDPELVWLKVDPRFDKVRSAPGFQTMLRRMGL
jgi:serine/threonine-protein kinase